MLAAVAATVARETLSKQILKIASKPLFHLDFSESVNLKALFHEMYRSECRHFDHSLQGSVTFDIPFLPGRRESHTSFGCRSQCTMMSAQAVASTFASVDDGCPAINFILATENFIIAAAIFIIAAWLPIRSLVP
jgi:hypothetical protein